jgi:hypothetical protein
MRQVVRLVVLAVLVATLGATFTVPASAAWLLIRYRGETSAPNFNDVELKVLKRDNGTRAIFQMSLETRVKCEDGSSDAKGMGTGHREPIARDGSFEFTTADAGFRDDHRHIRIAGQIGFRRGSGTFIYNEAALTNDGSDAQLCTTGDLTWTVERVGISPVPGAASRGVVHTRPGA